MLGALSLALILPFCAPDETFAQTSSMPAQQRAGTKRALLIGINTYKAVPSLGGSLNDVHAMREVLLTRWGFNPPDIRILTEHAATRAGILSAIQQLAKEAAPNDVVYLHYSGHGSQVQDLNGDEEDGLDETLVPHDGRTKGIRDITDDELDALFAPLRAKAVVIVLDSCHSGTATRALDIRTRSIPRDTRLDLYQDQEPTIATRAIVPRMQARHIVMSGAAADQEALDGPIEGEYRGFFSYALSRSLAASGPNASPKAVFVGVERELKRIQTRFGRNSMPEPQLEGPPALLDSPLLTTSETPASDPGTARLAWLEARPEPDGTVMLINGALLGAMRGSTWSIYAPGESSFVPGRALALARVISGAGKDSRATLEPRAARVSPGSRAIMAMPAPAASRITVRIADTPEPRRRDIETILRRTIQNVDIVTGTESASFLMDTQGDAVRLLTADGLQVIGVFDARTEQWSQAVARVFTRSSNAADLLTLDNPTSLLQISAQIAAAPKPSARDIIVASTRPADLRFRKASEPRFPDNSLQLLISVSNDAYVTIVDVDSEGAVHLLFPNDAQRPDFIPHGLVRAHQPVLIPDSLAPGNRAGFFWDYGPPAGIDTIRVFASTDLETARLIRDRVRAAQGAGPGFEGLRRDLAGLATRGIAVIADEAPASANTFGTSTAPSQVADWAATTLNVAIHE